MSVIPGKSNAQVAREIGVHRDTLASWPINRPELVNKLQLAYMVEQGQGMTRKAYGYRMALSKMMELYGKTKPQILDDVRTKPYMFDQMAEIERKALKEWDKCLELGYIAGLAGMTGGEV